MSKKSFKIGLVDGFTSSFAFFVNVPLDPTDYKVTTRRAWEDVGAAFEGVMREEGKRVGKERIEDKHKHKHKHSRPQAAA